MAVAFDAYTHGSENTSSLTVTASHGGASSGVEGVYVLASFAFDGGRSVSSASYGGTALTNSVTIARGSGLPWTWYFGFLGGGSVPQGTQTASVTWDGGSTSSSKYVTVLTLTADGTLSFHDSDPYQIDNEANPSDTLALSSTVANVVMALGTAESGGITAATDFTERGESAVSVGVHYMATYDTVGSSDVTYGATLSAADGGMFAIATTEATGNAPLSADSGSFTLTGTAADIMRARPDLSADPGSFSLTGAGNSIEANRLLSAESGSFTKTGTDAVLVGSVAGLTADSGTFTLSGTAADLLFGPSLDAETAAFILTGTDVNLTTDERLIADSASFTLSGTSTGLYFGAYFLAEMGVVQMDADDVTFSAGIELTALSGTFTLTGTANDFERAFAPLTGDSASFVLSGTVTDIVANRYIDAETTAYALIGEDVTFSAAGAFALSADPGGYVLTGTDIALDLGPVLTGESGAYTYTGATVTLDFSGAGQTLVAAKSRIDKRDLRYIPSKGRITRLH